MSRLFTPTTPAGQHVQQLLLEHREGLTLDQIRSQLRRKGRLYTLDNLRELLDNHPDVFVRHANGIYQLKSVAVTETDEDEIDPASEDSTDVETTIQNLPLYTSDYVVFDLETTGFEPKSDRIIQISALKVKAGVPAQALDLYCSPYPLPISYALKIKLGLAAHPEREAKMRDADPVEEQIDQFRVFIGELPLIAHNGRFDMGFIKAAAPDVQNPLLDTMELAHLVFPAARSRKLEDLAAELQITPENPTEKGFVEEIVAQLGLDFDWSEFHSAIVDVVFLQRVYVNMLHWLKNCPRRIADPIATLFPELAPIVSGTPESKLAPMVPDFLPTISHSMTDMEERARFIDTFSPESAEETLGKFLDSKGYGRREGQVTMMRRVSEALSDDRFRLIEAPTGTGKTLAYLLPSILWALSSGEKVAVSTTVKNLQDQLVDELESISNTLHPPFQFCRLKGRSSYFCLSRFQRYLEELDLAKVTNEEKLCIAYLFAWLAEDHDGGLDGTSYWFEMNFPLFAALKSEFAAQPDLPCHFGENCFRAVAYRQAEAADLLVLNHALWFSEPKAMPPVTKVVFDEAHHLEEVATSAWTDEVSCDSLIAIYNKVHHPRTRRGLLARIQKQNRRKEVIDLLQQIRANLTKTRSMTVDFGQELVTFVKACNATLDEKYGAKLRLERDPKKIEPRKWYGVERAKEQLQRIYLGDLMELLGKLRDLLSVPRAPNELIAELDAVKDALTEQNTLMDEIVKVGNLKRVYWVEVVPQDPEDENTDYRWGFFAAPIDVAPLLAEKYGALSAAIFTSATLSVRGGDFSFFVNRLGLSDRTADGDIVQIPPTELDYRNAFLGLTNYLNYRPVRQTMESFKQEMSDELSLFFEFTGGRGLTLFTARDRLAYAADRCEPSLSRLSIPLYWQKPSGSRAALTEEFREQETSVLFGLKSFWEGVDVPGQSLSFVVMEKLPFPFLGDPLFKARREKVRESGQHEFEDYIFPLMAIQFKQGFGRLLRKREDRGAVLLLDRRIHTKSYRLDLLGSLPGYRRDPDAESSRKQLYKAIANHLPALLSDRDDFLANLPDELLTDLLVKIEEYQLPTVMSDAEYDRYRESHILPAIREVMGYDGFRSEEQEQIVRAILTGRDVVGLLPTGAGKSFCFQFPALLRKGTTIVFSPLIALMRDQTESLRRRGLEIVDCIVSGQRAEDREEVYRRMRTGQARLVYISPERLRDLQLIECLRETSVIQVVVDEAHCISLWGTSFRPDFLFISRIFEQIQGEKRPPIAAFTATATRRIKTDIVEKLTMESPLTLQSSFDRPELRLVLYNATSPYNPINARTDKFRALMKIAKAAELKNDPVLVYVSTTVEAETIARKLQLSGFNARFYHGKMLPEDRQSVQDLFLDDMVSIVVCTKAFGMGIDKPDVRYVVHYNIPSDLESYYQEAGRAGRDLDEAYCALLYHESDLSTQRYFHQSALPSPIDMQRLVDFLKDQKADAVYLDPSVTCGLLDIEETELRILLYHLEADGFIDRDADSTAKASLTLQMERAEIRERVAQLFGSEASTFLALLDHLDVPAYRSTVIELTPLCDASGLSLTEVERCLVQMALNGLVLFRPFEKGIRLRLLPKLMAGEHFSADSETYRRDIEARLGEKLNQMVKYATTAVEGECLRKQILTYFGEPNPPQRCGNCSVCTPELELPWGRIIDRDLPSVSDFFDPAYTILQLVHWNEMLADEKYRSPYGIKSLPYLLTGNDYQLLRHITAPTERATRGRRFRECPYWGVLDTLPRREKAIQNLMTRLENEGFIGLASRSFNQEGQVVEYQYPVLLEKGKRQLLEGELLDWSI